MSEPQQGAHRRLLLAYAEGSRDLVAPLRSAFQAAGFDVVSASDAQPPSSEALDWTTTVVVCWTPAAVASDGVNLQAARAFKARKLVGVLLAPTAPPASLGRPLADLSGWRGDATDAEFLKLVHTLHARLSGGLFSSDFWRSRYLSWGGLGAATLGAIAIIANLGDLTQTIDGLANPAASQRDLNATNAKVEEVLTLLKQRSAQPLSGEAELVLRDSLEDMLSAQSGFRGEAARKLTSGDLKGAVADLQAAADEGENAISGVAQTWRDIGALTFLSDTFTAMDAYERADQLSPGDPHTLSQLGSLYIRTGRLDEAQYAFDRLHLSAQTDDEVASALGNLGMLASIRGDLPTAERHIRDALAINQRIGNVAGQAADLNDLGDLLRQKGQLTEAERTLRSSLEMNRAAGFEAGEASVLMRIGALASDRNRRTDAAAAYGEARKIFEAIGDLEGITAALNSQASLAFDRGDLTQATTLLDRALDVARQAAARESEAYALGLIGQIAESRQQTSKAIEHYRDAATIYEQIGMMEFATPLREALTRLGAKPHPEGPEN